MPHPYFAHEPFQDGIGTRSQQQRQRRRQRPPPRTRRECSLPLPRRLTRFVVRSTFVFLLGVIWVAQILWSATYLSPTIRSIESATMLGATNATFLPPSSALPPPLPLPPLSHTSFVDGWKRITLAQRHNNIEEEDMVGNDNFMVGRSCQWESYSMYGRWARKVWSLLIWFWSSPTPPVDGQWVCRDCGDAKTTPTTPTMTTLYSNWKDCPILPQRGKCPAFRQQPWDGPKPRSRSTYDASSLLATRVLTTYGVGKVRKVEYEQPQCFGLHLPCFDIRRCETSNPTTATSKDNNNNNNNHSSTKTTLTVFVHAGQARQDFQQAFQLMERSNVNQQSTDLLLIRLVDDPRSACLLIVHQNDLSTAKASGHWNFGRNHYVYGVTQPIVEENNVHFDLAAVGSVAWVDAQMRWGYDVAVPLPAKWIAPPPSSSSSSKDGDMLLDSDHYLHRPRKYLLSFQGSLQDTLQPYYQHRWLAAEYLHREADVVIDVQCKHKTLWGDRVTTAPYDNPDTKHFDELMSDSTFAFCPGGSQVSSFRFNEVLSTGSIPVLPPEVVVPFAPEMDWSRCVVRVSQARIIDLPRILRAMPSAEIRDRQKECRRLYRFIRNDDDSELPGDNPKAEKAQSINSLVTTLKIWASRLQVQQYHIELTNQVF